MMKYLYLSILCIGVFSSCKTSQSVLYDPKEVKELSHKLQIPISNLDADDDRNMPLFAEASLWLGVPYRYGGTTRKGADCSGFTAHIYKKVYSIKLPRSSSDMADVKAKKVEKSELKAGDLVFFATSSTKGKITHVGIFLKNGNFIHASTSKGVIVSNLSEGYYSQRYVKANRLK